MNHNDERDYAEEDANRAAVEAENHAEYQAERINRIRQRLTYRIVSAGIQLHIDTKPYRLLVQTPRRKRDLPPLVALLEQAADLGAVHGRCNTRAELAAALLTEPGPPGHVIYDLAPSRTTVIMHRDGNSTALAVPGGLKPFYLIGQLARALSGVFAIAGQLADEPEAATPPATPTDEPVPWTIHHVRDTLTQAKTATDSTDTERR